MFLWRNTKLTIKGVMPDLLHVIPILNDTMLDGLLNSKYSALLLSLVTNVDFLLIEANHDARHLRATNDC